jgi:uncharacterized caspase-like protein
MRCAGRAASLGWFKGERPPNFVVKCAPHAVTIFTDRHQDFAQPGLHDERLFMSAFFRIGFLLLITGWFGCAPALADKRVALVIGNGAYAHAPKLPNPAHDAQDVAAALKRSNFDVIFAADAGQTDMQEATIRFARSAASADVAVFYYSGHAMQFNGVNYLMPVDAKLDDEADLKRFARVDDILNDLEQAKNLRILVLDSCRDNPLTENLKQLIGVTRGASIHRGLVKMEAPLGTIISFSTQAGQTADDGQGRNSPYTAAFLKHIEEHQEIGDIFREVSTDVYEASSRTQLPELSLSVVGKFYLNGPVSVTIAPPAPSAAVNPCAEAESHWNAANSIGTVAAYEDHLSRFPNCAFSSLAKAKVDELKQKLALATPEAARASTIARTKDFDGKWDVTVKCTNASGALAYMRNLTATVTDGVLHGEDQANGRPLLAIDGEIPAGGKAILNAHGFTGDSAFGRQREARLALRLHRRRPVRARSWHRQAQRVAAV